jgi:hypothetical protein
MKVKESFTGQWLLKTVDGGRRTAERGG